MDQPIDLFTGKPVPFERYSQVWEVARYLDRHTGLTPLEASSRFGITRLADIIYKLRGHGWPIKTTPRKGSHALSNGKRRPYEYALYSLPRDWSVPEADREWMEHDAF